MHVYLRLHSSLYVSLNSVIFQDRLVAYSTYVHFYSLKSIATASNVVNTSFDSSKDFCEYVNTKICQYELSPLNMWENESTPLKQMILQSFLTFLDFSWTTHKSLSAMQHNYKNARCNLCIEDA